MNKSLPDTQESSSEYETESGSDINEDFDLSEVESITSDVDEYFEDSLIPEDSVNDNNGNHSPPISGSKHDQTFTDVNFEWTTGYTTRWRQSTRSATTNNNPPFPNCDLLTERSKSEMNLSLPQSKKKRLSVDLSSPVESNLPTSSLFKSIGNWFRGSIRSTAPKLNNSIEESVPNTKQTASRTKSVVGTDFSSLKINMEATKKRVIKFDEDSLSTSEEETSSDEASETSSTESSSKMNKFRNLSSVDSCLEDPLELETTFQLMSSEQPQCLSWQRQFRKIPGVVVENKKICSDLVADALVVPGNSFGILDGWPEIEYVKLFGWQLQRNLQKTICEKFDGELLVGQAILLPLSPEVPDDVTTESDHNDITMESGHNDITIESGHNDITTESGHNDITIGSGSYGTNSCPGVKHVVYVPVMRVPINLQDSVNAYLAFKAAICAVKKHNINNTDNQIKTIVCPPLCSDLGMMTANRIALQMRTAYEAFVLNKRPKISEPSDLGYLATNHVDLTTAKAGGWC